MHMMEPTKVGWRGLRSGGDGGEEGGEGGRACHKRGVRRAAGAGWAKVRSRAGTPCIGHQWESLHAQAPLSQSMRSHHFALALLGLRGHAPRLCMRRACLGKKQPLPLPGPALNFLV